MADKDSDKSSDQELLTTIRERYKRAFERWNDNYEKAREDIRFAAASPDDPWQWDNLARKQRDLDARPTLTINVMPQHIRQVTNDIRQNRPSIKVRPVDDNADVQTADVFDGIIRHIQANSRANIAYNTAANYAVTGGIGYIRIVTDYREADGFDQDLYIDAVTAPFTHWPDDMVTLPDASDATWWLVETSLSKEEFETEYPNAEPIDFSSLGRDESSWVQANVIRVCEYWYFESGTREKLQLPDGSTIWTDEVDEAMREEVSNMAVRKRQVDERKVCWVKTNGVEILERGEWAGRYLPFVRVIGNEWIVDDKPVISGIVRNAKDAQRMFNYSVSANAEHVALRTKTPWVAPDGAIEGFEEMWATANTRNHSVLYYNNTDENGNPLPAPSRTQPPEASQGWTALMQFSVDQIKQTTGQYDASLGAKSNETSGRAIMARQREGDTGTYHFMDNLALAIEQIGKILVDAAPKVLDTPQIVRILGEDGAVKNARLDPNQTESVIKKPNGNGGFESIYNIGVGKYDVDISVGPSFNTKRQEGADFLQTLVQSSPQTLPMIGDLLFKIQDVPYSDEIAKRFKAMLPPPIQQMLDAEASEITPEQALQMKNQLQQAQDYIQKLERGFQAAHDELKSKQQENDDKLVIARMQEETKRSTAFNADETKKDVVELQGAIAILTAQLPQLAAMFAAQELNQRGAEDFSPQQEPLPDEQPPQQAQPQQQPASAGFFSPEQGQPAPVAQPQQGGIPGQ